MPLLFGEPMSTASPESDADALAYRQAAEAVDAIYRLAPAMLALARRLPSEDAELIHRVIEALPLVAPGR